MEEYEEIVTAESAEDMLRGNWRSIKPLIRCKNCKHYSKDNWFCRLVFYNPEDFTRHNRPVDPEGYCAWGELKEDEAD